jgi:hypothetical protein
MFGSMGLRTIIGTTILFFMSFYLLLNKTNLGFDEKVMLSFFLGIGFFPVAVYYLGFLFGIRFSIVAAFLLFLVIGALINKYTMMKKY